MTYNSNKIAATAVHSDGWKVILLGWRSNVVTIATMSPDTCNVVRPTWWRIGDNLHMCKVNNISEKS